MSTRGKLVILSGPSCVGKSPLVKALAQFYPAIYKKLQPLVLYNSRPPRPGEKDGEDYHFRQRQEIDRLREKENFIVMDVRGDLQALDLEELRGSLESADVLFEGNPFVGTMLLTHPKLENIERLSIFIAPLSREEFDFLRRQPGIDLRSLVSDVMRRKLLRRMQRQKSILSARDLEEAERRAGSALRELGMAHRFQNVIANHDGEDSDNWSAFYFPLGDARKTLLAVAALLDGKSVPVESWTDFLPSLGETD